MKTSGLKVALWLIIAIFLPIFTFTLPAVLLAQDSSDDEENLEGARDRLEELGEERAVMERELQELRQAENLALDELEEIDQELTTISRRLERTTSELETKRAQVDFLNASNEQAVSDLEAAQKRFEARLVAWYKSGGTSILGTMISTGDLADFFHIMYYMEEILKSDQENIAFIREQQGLIFEQTEELNTEIAECERLLGEMREDENHYQELRETRYSRMAAIAGDVDTAEQALRELEASSYEIAMLLQRSTYTSPSAGGPLIRPIDAPITSGFGMRRHPIFGGMRMHTGVDMPAPYGTNIHAARDGLVVFAGWKRGYGNCITIDHGNGLATLYAHCSSLEVSVGETVRRGQVIARVGSTGWSTGNHLHFEVRINGEPVDPEGYI
jgi:murein DD-endopeptidase MepM/ murein hydrolase activator NlpD